MKKFHIGSIVLALIIIAATILFFNKSSLQRNLNLDKVSDQTGDRDIIRIIVCNDIIYRPSKEIVTDEKIIGEAFGTIKHQITNKDSASRKTMNGDSTVFPKGTGLYEVKGYDMKDLLAVKDTTGWLIYRSESTNKPSINIFTEEMYSADKIVVSKIDGSGRKIVKEITSKNAISTIANCLKIAGSLSPVGAPSSYSQEPYTYYFEIKDKSGIGKIALPYTLYFQNVDLNSSVYAENFYKLGTDFNKLITEPFGTNTTPYDNTLGGEQQVFDCDLSTPKLTFKRYIKEPTPGKYEATLLSEGSQVWQNGVKVNDNLKGKWKLEIVLKNTQVQQKVIDKCIQNMVSFNGAVSISFTKGDSKDSTIMYIGFDNKPGFIIDEYGDSFMIILNTASK